MNIHHKDAPRFVLSIGILLIFAYAYVRNPTDDLLVGSLIAMATTAVNWWLGSSKGSSDKSDQLERQSEGPTGSKDDPLAVEGAAGGSTPVPVREKGKPGG